MSKNPVTTPATTPRPLEVTARPDEPRDAAYSRAVLSPTVSAAVTSLGAGSGVISVEEMTPQGHREAIDAKVQQVQAGDLSGLEAMLTAQAVTLEQLFHNMIRRGMKAGHVENMERYLKLGLKAQSQCRATIEALAEVKHPRVAVFANQANVTSGPQQVNNGTPSPAPAHGQTSDKPTMTNELLEHDDGERLDTRATGPTGRGNQTVEAVGEKHRTPHRRRQGSQ